MSSLVWRRIRFSSEVGNNWGANIDLVFTCFRTISVICRRIRLSVTVEIVSLASSRPCVISPNLEQSTLVRWRCRYPGQTEVSHRSAAVGFMRLQRQHTQVSEGESDDPSNSSSASSSNSKGGIVWTESSYRCVRALLFDSTAITPSLFLSFLYRETKLENRDTNKNNENLWIESELAFKKKLYSGLAVKWSGVWNPGQGT